MGSRSNEAVGSSWIAIVVLLVAGVSLVGCGDDDPTKPESIPVINALTAGPVLVMPGEATLLSCTATDVDPNELDFAWQVEGGTIAGQGASVTWTVPDTDDYYQAVVTVTNGSGGTARDTVGIGVIGGSFLTRTDEAFQALDVSGRTAAYQMVGIHVEVLGDRLFTFNNAVATEYDLNGNFVWSRRLTDSMGNYGFAVLPGGNLACISNRHEAVYVFNANGDTLASPAIPNPAEGDFMTGAVVAGDRLVLANNGNGNVIAVDLATYEASILYTVPQGGPLASQIEYLDGRFYISRGDCIETFSAEGELTEVCDLEAGNILGMAFRSGFLFASVSPNALYWIDVATGRSGTLTETLANPRDLEYVEINMAD